MNKTVTLLAAVAFFCGGLSKTTGQEDVDAISKGKKPLEELVESGDPEAQHILSVLYNEGVYGKIKNPEKAFQLMKKSAYQGYVSSFPEMAVHYLGGIGVEQDTVESYAWTLLYKASVSEEDEAREEEAWKMVANMEEKSSLRNDAKRRKQGQDRTREIQKEIEANKKAKKEAEEKINKDDE